MSYYRKCEDCGCTLDPGEGRICDECAEKMRQKQTAGRCSIK